MEINTSSYLNGYIYSKTTALVDVLPSFKIIFILITLYLKKQNRSSFPSHALSRNNHPTLNKHLLLHNDRLHGLDTSVLQR